jgi:tetratricopeptide (TPR) repeat protein
MDHPTEFDRLLASGLDASRRGVRDQALALFAQASEAAPASGVPHFLIASELASAGDFASAEMSFARAVVLAPSFTLARYQLGLLQFTSARVPLAMLTWEPLLSLPESNALLHFVRGFASLAQDAYGESLHHLRAGLACEPSNPPLCSDILRLVEAVERLQQDSEAPAAAHVLLSAYAPRVH